jgi:hypothetical protein
MSVSISKCRMGADKVRKEPEPWHTVWSNEGMEERSYVGKETTKLADP